MRDYELQPGDFIEGKTVFTEGKAMTPEEIAKLRPWWVDYEVVRVGIGTISARPCDGDTNELMVFQRSSEGTNWRKKPWKTTRSRRVMKRRPSSHAPRGH